MNRYDIINLLIKKHGYDSYLEIGVEGGESFDRVNCKTKHGVDPNSDKATFKVESNTFFNMLADAVEYDIVFIDGLHVAEQAKLDIKNALRHLDYQGAIVVHDCNPPTAWHQRSYEEFLKHPYQWNGDVWKAVVEIRRSLDNINVDVVDTDWGCAVITYNDMENTDLLVAPPMEDLTYEMLEANRKEWLNLITPSEFLEKYIAS